LQNLPLPLFQLISKWNGGIFFYRRANTLGQHVSLLQPFNLFTLDGNSGDAND
jgi:hypothetical protein